MIAASHIQQADAEKIIVKTEKQGSNQTGQFVILSHAFPKPAIKIRKELCKMSRDSPVNQRLTSHSLNKLRTLIQQEINQVVVKDTYTKGKHAGLRKALALIDEMQSETVP